MTPVPFWLMIVSSAIVVLPVWRSPMISSRWPRPMGIMASMALMPVWSGSFTGWRSITPGALNSTLRNLSAPIGPLPSTGWPIAFTTRPIISLPTGTEAMRPVRSTRSPSLMFLSEPNSTAPTLSSSRFNTMPMTSPGKRISSPAIASSSPQSRAMPSPTDSTLPTLLVSSLASYRSSSCARMALTSSGRKDIGSLPRSFVVYSRRARWRAGRTSLARHQAALHGHFLELPGDGAEQAPDAAIDDAVADAHVGAAAQRGIQPRLEHDVLPREPFELRMQPLLLGLRERHGAHHHGALESLRALHDGLELVRDGFGEREPVLAQQQVAEHAHGRQHLPRESAFEHLAPVVGADLRVEQELAQARPRRHERRDALELHERLLEQRQQRPAVLRRLLLREDLQRARVPGRDRGVLDHRSAPTSSMNCAVSRRWAGSSSLVRRIFSAVVGERRMTCYLRISF